MSNTTPRSNAKEIADTILAQLGGNRLSVMTGAKSFTYDARGSLSFRLPSRFAKDGINYVKVELTDEDLYNLTFGSIRGTSYKVKATVEGAYSDMLQNLFRNATGLELSLGTMRAA